MGERAKYLPGEKEGGSGAAVWGLFLSGALLLGALVFQVGLQLHMKQINYALARELKQQDLLQEENRRLKVERATLRSPERIERLARERLEMNYPARDQVIFVK
jgi:cell division protein FtsL